MELNHIRDPDLHGILEIFGDGEGAREALASPGIILDTTSIVDKTRNVTTW